ncbi:MAG TPA: hypothetical protein P5320_02730 [Bacteroidales bacterium]|nr:hypothetical protein [Bacteroidales bacterium]HOK73904.1 hypothetical protein [Bacteroidales bacterium]HOM39585.1 hypothetical protein [Bacteroidales bacterium]HPP91967.1 hypothetical protein [Bacteroidales bacterium]HQK70796.1 hypothetical protein [Bacteroidales bacterium]
MGRNVKIIILSGLLLTSVAALYGQRGMRGWADTSSLKRPGWEMRMRQMPAIKEIPDSLRKGIRRGYRHGYGRTMPFDHGMWNMPYRRVPERFGPGWFYGPERVPYTDPFRFGRRDFVRPVPPAMAPERPPMPYIYRIPDLTDKQKKEIESLREKFRDEMNKFREENRRKMDEMRKSHLDKIKNLLTPEQKKWLEERIPQSTESKKI